MNTGQEPKYKIVEGKIVNRVTGIPIPDDEPVFILRAKDIHACEALLYYADLCWYETHSAVVMSRFEDFRNWKANNFKLTKEPDSEMQTTTT